MKPYLTFIIGGILGLSGYFASTFWIQPIIRYREIKCRILGQLIYFRNAYEDETTETLKEIVKANPDSDIQDAVEYHKTRMREKELECRKLSGELSATFIYLPCWYKFFS